MSRSRIISANKDLMSDKGSILLSIVRGEQFEFPVICDFLDIADTDYTYEAVIIEGSNDGEGSYPTQVQAGGVADTLNVRLCSYEGAWDSNTAYDQEDVVLYTDGNYYRLGSGTAYTTSTNPLTDPSWIEHDPRTVYVQFPSTFCVTSPYSQLPLPDAPTYGFFELSVTEADNPVYISIWKPARGLVEILFSPTELV